MNKFFVFVGTILLLTLSAALVVPRYIDWSDYTTTVGQQMSRLLGRDVEVSGSVDLRLLPMPRLTFTEVEVAGEAADAGPVLTVDRVEALLSLAPFLRGRAEIVELTLERPTITLSAIEPATNQGQSAMDPGSVSVEEARIIGGRILRQAASGEEHVLIDDLSARLAAPSILGPWRVDPASAIIGGERVELNLNSGTYANDQRLRLRVSVDPVNRPVSFDLDGHLDWSGEAARFQGRALAQSAASSQMDEAESEGDQLSGSPPAALRWRVEGDVDAALDEIAARQVSINLGQEGDQAFQLTGDARFQLGERPSFNAALSSRQVDLDRTLGGGATEPVSVTDGWAALGEVLEFVERSPMPGQVAFNIPAIVLGGSVIRDIGFDANYAPDLPLEVDNLEATLPGESLLRFEGALDRDTLDGTLLDGAVSLRSAAAGLLIGWSTGRQDEQGAMSQIRSLEIDGRVTANDSGAVLDRLVGSIDGEPLAGRVEYTGAGSATERGARLDAALEAGRFDFGFLAGASSWLLNSSGADGANARAIDTLNVDLNIAALMAGSEDLGQVLVNLSSTPERTRVDQLEIGDAAGARLSASGFIEHGQIPPVGNFSVNAELDEIGGLVRLARDLFGESPFLADLQRNRGLYEPMVLTGSYGNQQGEGVQLGITGEIAGTEIDVTGTVQPSASVRSLAETVQNSAAVLFENGSEIRVNARADDAFALIGQLGIPALPPNLSGPGELFAVVTKAEQDAPTFRLAFDGLENTLRVDGELTGDAVSGISGLQGSGSLFVGDVAQVGLMAGIALPGLFEPFSASAGFDVDYARADQRIELSSLEGFVADVPLSGSASVEQTPLGAKIAADLSASEMSLPQVLAGFVGPSAFDQGVEIDWPEGPIAFNPLPADISLTLRSPRLALWDDLTLLGANAQLLARGDELSIESLSGSLKGGDLDARLVVRDTDQGGLLNGRLTWTDIALADMSWRPAGAALVEGTGGITATLESAGNSIRGLLSGLSGDGTIQLTDMTVRGIGVAGFARVLQASDAGLLPEEADLDEAFSEALRASSMRVDRVDTPITVVGGVIRASNLYIEGEQTAIRGGFTLDLAESLVDANFSLAPTQGRSDVSAMPNIGLSFNGPVSRPERALDASQVASFLNVRQLEREIQRVEDLNAEILERETLLRFLAAIELDEARLERLSELRAVRQRRQDAASEAPTIPLPPLNIPDVSPSDRSSIDEAPGQTIGEDEVSELPPLEPPITVESNAVVRVNPLSLGESVPATAPPLDLNPN